jgi:hypothetical protein
MGQRTARVGNNNRTQIVTIPLEYRFPEGMKEVCRCRRQIDPACRFPVTQRDDPGIVAGRGMAAADGGSRKCRHLGQIRVGANTLGSRSLNSQQNFKLSSAKI